IRARPAPRSPSRGKSAKASGNVAIAIRSSASNQIAAAEREWTGLSRMDRAAETGFGGAAVGARTPALGARVVAGTGETAPDRTGTVADTRAGSSRRDAAAFENR